MEEQKLKIDEKNYYNGNDFFLSSINHDHSNTSKLINDYINNSNNKKGTSISSSKIHNLNKRKNNTKNEPIEIYGEDDFDFNGMEDKELKIDEKLLINSNVKNKISNTINNDNNKNSNKKRRISNNSSHNSNEEDDNDEDDLNIGKSKKLRMNKKLSKSSKKKSSTDNSHVNKNKKKNLNKTLPELKIKTKAIETYNNSDFDLSDMKDQKLKIDEKLLGSSSNNKNSIYYNPSKLMDYKKKKVSSNDEKKLPYNTISLSSYNVYLKENTKNEDDDNNNSNTYTNSDRQDMLKSSSLEVYDSDYDFSSMDGQKLKIDEKIVSSTASRNSSNLNPHKLFNTNDTSSSTHKKKSPYNIISLASYRAYLRNNDNNGNPKLNGSKLKNIENYDDDYDNSNDGNEQKLKMDEKLVSTNKENSIYLNTSKLLHQEEKHTSNNNSNKKEVHYKTISLSSYNVYLKDENETNNENDDNNLDEMLKLSIIEVYDDDFDFKNMKEKELKLDKNLTTPNGINPIFLNPKNYFTINENSSPKTKKLPYSTISLSSYNTYLQENGGSINKPGQKKSESSAIEVYDDDFDLKTIDGKELKFDKTLQTSNQNKSDFLNLSEFIDTNENVLPNKKKLPYSTISLSSYNTYLQKTKTKSNSNNNNRDIRKPIIIAVATVSVLAVLIWRKKIIKH